MSFYVTRRDSFVRLALGLALLAFSATASAEKPPHRLSVKVGSDAISITGATAAVQGVLIGYELTPRGPSASYRRVYRPWTSDAAGAATVELNRPVAMRSFWVAVDVSTGAHGASTPPGDGLREADVPPGALKPEEDGKVKKFALRSAYTYCLAVRPGVAAWEGLAGDGGDSDEDRALNGSVTSAVAGMKPLLGTNDDYEGAEPGDIIVIFLPHQMGFLITEVRK